jgi:hypothetical protein
MLKVISSWVVGLNICDCSRAEISFFCHRRLQSHQRTFNKQNVANEDGRNSQLTSLKISCLLSLMTRFLSLISSLSPN